MTRSSLERARSRAQARATATCRRACLERLGHIVDGMRIEGALSLMVECGHEYCRRRCSTKPFEKIEAGPARQLDVERDDVGAQAIDQYLGLVEVRGFAHDMDVRHCPKRAPDAAARERLVLDNQDREATHSVRSGISIIASHSPLPL